MANGGRTAGRPDNVYGNNLENNEEDPRGLSTFGGHAARRNPDGSITQSSAADAAQGYNQTAREAYNTPIQSLDYGKADQQFGVQGVDRALGLQSRQGQTDATGLLRNAAYGNAPSQAEILGRQQTQDSLNAQLAGASSAKGGPLAQMSAQRQALAGQGAFQQQANNSIAALRANEMAQARQGYAAQTNANRAGDISQQGVDLTAAGQRAQMAQAQGQYGLGQRALNQSREGMYAQLGYNTQNDEANRGVALSGQEGARWGKQMDTNQESKRDSQSLTKDIVNGVVSILPKLARGGPADGARPYIVGEKGPELVIPRHDGEVIPAHTTKSVLQALERQGGGPIDGATGMDRLKLADLSGDGSSGNVDLGGSGSMSGSTVLAASTGKTGNPMSPVGGGGVTGGGMPFGRREKGGGICGIMHRAGGGPVYGDATDKYFGNSPEPSSMTARTWGSPDDPLVSSNNYAASYEDGNVDPDELAKGNADSSALDDRYQQASSKMTPSGQAPRWLELENARNEQGSDSSQGQEQAPSAAKPLSNNRKGIAGYEQFLKTTSPDSPQAERARQQLGLAPLNSIGSSRGSGGGNGKGLDLSGLGSFIHNVANREGGGEVKGGFTVEDELQKTAAAQRQPKTFKRDTPQDQANVKRSYHEGEAARMKNEADALIALMNSSMAAGPSVKRDDDSRLAYASPREGGGAVEKPKWGGSGSHLQRRGRIGDVTIGVSADEGEEPYKEPTAGWQGSVKDHSENQDTEAASKALGVAHLLANPVTGLVGSLTNFLGRKAK